MSTRVLVLSGSPGAMGEECFAEACVAALEPYDVICETVDLMSMLGRLRNRFFAWIFRMMYFRPALFDAYHFSQLRIDSPVSKRTNNRFVVDAIAPRLQAKIDEFRPDVVLSVFPLAGLAVSRLRGHGYGFRHVFLVSDSFATCWQVQESTDLFLVNGKVTAASIRRFVPDARVEVVVLPVRPQFWDAPSQARARESLGVPQGSRCVLLMSSALGIGPLDAIARELAEHDYWVLAVAGTNARLAGRLTALSATHPNLLAFGFTDRVAELMAACDVVISCGGANTCREARVVGRSLVLLDVLPGHGRENVMHELAVGSAAVASPEPSVLRRAVDAFLSSELSRPPVRPDRRESERKFVESLRAVGVELCPRRESDN